MESWDDAIDELRQEYLLEAPGQIAGIRGLLAQLRVEPGDKDLLTELRRGFHGFAGFRYDLRLSGGHELRPQRRESLPSGSGERASGTRGCR